MRWLLSTATQPAFEAIAGFAGLPAQEIVPDAAHYFQAFRRVSYEWCTDPALSWLDVAGLIKEEQEALCLVISKMHALPVLAALNDRYALRLSTMLRGERHAQFINNVKVRLSDGAAYRLVTT